jgi:hypothetical protein
VDGSWCLPAGRFAAVAARRPLRRGARPNAVAEYTAPFTQAIGQSSCLGDYFLRHAGPLSTPPLPGSRQASKGLESQAPAPVSRAPTWAVIGMDWSDAGHSLGTLTRPCTRSLGFSYWMVR